MFDINPQQCRVALLCGGTSGERDISLESGQGARKALEEAGFDVTLLDPANKEDLQKLVAGNFDVAFICLHGEKGEDGAIQGFLETIGLPYTGSGICASAISLDKDKAKVFYEQAHIPSPRSIVLKRGEEYDVDQITRDLGEHCVIKPVFGGSSLGLVIVEGQEAIADALESALEQDEAVLVEQYVSGLELTVAVLGTEEPRALPVIEIIPKNDTYDFESKYSPGGCQHICPARLSDAVAEQVKELAVEAHKVLGCSGVSRSDFLLDENGDVWLLETNTIPGMTEASLLPDAARAAGIEAPELYTFLISEALAAAADRT